MKIIANFTMVSLTLYRLMYDVERVYIPSNITISVVSRFKVPNVRLSDASIQVTKYVSALITGRLNEI